MGCASSSPELKLTSIGRRQTFRQDFTRAYCRQDSRGNLDLVLLDQAAQENLSGSRTTAALRQVMHIRVLWTPSREMKAVATNATIKWYVISQDSPRDVLEYAGTGFVALTPDGDTTSISIKNALLKPLDHHGALNDPVGVSRLEGSITATQDQEKVQRVLGDLTTTLAAADANARAATE